MSVGKFEIRCHPELNAIIVYDVGPKPKVATEITLFALDRLLRGDFGTVYQSVLNIAAFCSHCRSKGVDPIKARNRHLVDFRDAELSRVLANPRGLGDPWVSKSTVNQKLISVYRWFLWMREVGRIPARKVGPKGTQITVGVSPGSPVSTEIEADTTKALYLKTSESDRGIQKHLLSDNQREDLAASIMSSRRSEYARNRDALILDIGCETGFRRGSINSLSKEQFDRRLLDQCTGDTVLVSPSRQKFSRGTVYEIPLSLAYRIADFIEGPRKSFLEEVGQDEDSVPQLFLSERNGQPLKDRSITTTFSSYLRGIGAPRWNAVHVFRRRYANVMIVQETALRLQAGLDTSTQSIATAVAMKLGQRSSKSLLPYVLLHQSRLGMKLSSTSQARLRAAETKILEQSRQIEQLQALIANLRSGSGLR